MKIKNITTGILNEIKNFYGNVEIDENKLPEAYELLKDEISDEMKSSPEFFVGEFEKDGKSYVIAGDGALTSSGEYVLAEIEKTYEALSMYMDGAKIKDILAKTKVSRTALYSALKKTGQSRKKNISKIHISIDEDVQGIMEKEHPDNVSKWICDKIKAANKGPPAAR
ncbi:MAG: hypothetical protein ACKOWO_03210 [Sediminibacterium sp.]